MKKSVRTPLSRALLLCFASLGVVCGVHAQEAGKLELVGYTGYLPEQARQSLSQILGAGVGKSGAEFAQVLSQAQQWLDQKYPNVYVLSTEVKGGGRVVNLQLRLGEVIIDTSQSKGYDAANIRASLPSLQEGLVLSEGQDWLNIRELNQANENPLKQTRVKFEVEPGQAVKAVVQAQSSGSSQSVASVDNYAGSATGRERLSYFYTNGNTFGGDEVLRFFGQVGLSDPSNVYGIGLSYSMPFYASGQSILFSAVRSNATVENLPLIEGGLSLKGKGDQLDFQWTKDLPRWGLGLNDAPRLTLGVSWRKFFNQATLDGAGGAPVNAEPTTKELPLHVGLSNAVRFSPSTDLLFAVTGSWYQPRGSNKIAFEANRVGSGKGYTLLRYSAGVNSQVGSFPVSATVLGQYTSDKLIGNNQMSVVGTSAVRGFVNPGSTLSGDKAVVGRFQVGTPTLYLDGGQGGVNLYGFFDVGHKSGGASESKETVSSVGLGVNYQLPQVSMGAYVAQVLEGRKENNAKEPSLWVQAQASF